MRKIPAPSRGSSEWPWCGFAARHTGQDIAGSHPAAEAGRFDGGAGGVGDPLIFGGVADENVVGNQTALR